MRDSSTHSVIKFGDINVLMIAVFSAAKGTAFGNTISHSMENAFYEEHGVYL